MKTFETLNHQDFLVYVGAVGNCTAIAKDLVSINENEMATKMLSIADFYASALTAEVEQLQVGIGAAFQGEEALSFHTIRGRLGYDTKVVHKILKEALKSGIVTVTGVGRAKRYSMA